LNTSVYFEFFDPKKVFKKKEQNIFVISSNSSIEWYKKNSMETLLSVHLMKNPWWFSVSPIEGKLHSPPTAHICFDRSFVALSNEMSPDAQSSLLIEFLALENPATERASRDPLSSDGSKNF
jgi:hypothetical protein